MCDLVDLLVTSVVNILVNDVIEIYSILFHSRLFTVCGVFLIVVLSNLVSDDDVYHLSCWLH